MSNEIKPRIVDGEPACSRDCPEYGANDHCMSRSPGCYLRKVHPCYNTPCIPGLRQQRDEAQVALESKELAVQEKTCSECQRECEIENRILIAKVERLKTDILAVMDALCLPGHVASEEWEDLCLLLGRYTDQWLNFAPTLAAKEISR